MTETTKPTQEQGLTCTQTIVYPQPFLEITQNLQGSPELHWSGNVLNFSKMHIDKHHNIAYLSLKNGKVVLWFNQQHVELEISPETINKTELLIQDHKTISITYPTDQGTKIQKVFVIKKPQENIPKTPIIEEKKNEPEIKIVEKVVEKIVEKPASLPKEWNELVHRAKKSNLTPDQILPTFEKQKQEFSALQNAFTLTKTKLTELEAQKPTQPQETPVQNGEEITQLTNQITELQTKLKEIQGQQEPLSIENKRLINQLEGMKVVITRLEQQLNEATEKASEPNEETQQHINGLQDQLLKKTQEINQYRALLSMIKSNAKKATFGSNYTIFADDFKQIEVYLDSTNS